MESKAKLIAEAKKRAVTPPATPEGVDWPRWEDVTIEDALTLLEIQVWDGGLRFSFGPGTDGNSLWARASAPKWSGRVELQGRSAITFSGDLDHLVRKLAQLATVHDPGVWKPDPYAK